METLRDIRNINTAIYCRNWLQEWDLCDASIIVEAIKDTPEEQLPLSKYCLQYIMNYFIENPNVTWIIKDEDKKVTSDPVRILEWSYEDCGPVYAFVAEEDVSNFIQVMSSVEMGATDLPEVVPCEELRKAEDFKDIEEYLKFLHIIQQEEVKLEVIPPIVEREDDIVTSRFSSAIWYHKIQEKEITLAGLGGIGSYVAFLLGRMHPKTLYLYDDDIVEAVNMSGQLYAVTDIFKHKVDAIAEAISKYSSYDKIFSYREKFTELSPATNIMISGFDNMKARKVFFFKWFEQVRNTPEEERKDCLLIDGRLAAEEFQVFCIRGDDYYDIKRYKDEFLFSDEEADPTICSYKQTTFMANMIGSVIVNLFTNFVANEIVDGLRELPFYTSYNAETMLLKTES